MGIRDTIQRGYGTLTGKNLEATADKLAEVHGEILLGMDARLDALDRKVSETADLSPIRQRLQQLETRTEKAGREARNAAVLGAVAAVLALAALLAVAFRWM